MTAAHERCQPKIIDPAELWEKYLAVTDSASPQGAMAFASAFYTARNAANSDHLRLANANLKDCLAASATLQERVKELLELVEAIPGTPDEDPAKPCDDLCGNSWCNEFGCIAQKKRDARAALSPKPAGREG